MGIRWVGSLRAACTSGVSGLRAGELLKQGLIRCCECEGMKRRWYDEMSGGIGQCVKMVKLLGFEPIAHAILTSPRGLKFDPLRSIVILVVLKSL
jgi:hypothetical protein